ncbi:hypothetical protein ACFL35_21350, partial [Candidatus Riflebacteria bacterium]
ISLTLLKSFAICFFILLLYFASFRKIPFGTYAAIHNLWFSILFFIFYLVFSIPFFNWIQGGNRRGTSFFISILLFMQFSLVLHFGYDAHWRNLGRQKSCFANIRVMEGAVEMYNMDNTKMMQTLDIENLLKKEKDGSSYLKNRPRCPGDFGKQGNYTGQRLATDGVISCTVHRKIPNIQ